MVSDLEFSRNYAQGFPGTVRLLVRRGFSDLDAEEIAQAAWVLAWKKRAAFRGASEFRTWVGAIAMNECRSRLKRKRRRAEEQISDTIVERVRCSRADVDQLLSRAQLVDLALAGVRRPYREVLILRFLRDLSPSETAARLGIDLSAAKNRQHRALNAARRCLERQTVRSPAEKAA